MQALATVEQLRAVANPLRQRILELLVMDALTTHQLAAAMSVPPNRLYYHVAALERAGLIGEVGRQRRRGAIERTYRATAREYSVDVDLIARPRERKTSRAQLSRALVTLFTNAARDVEHAARQGLLDDPQLEHRVVFEKQRIRGTTAELRRLRRRLQAWLADCERVNTRGAGGSQLAIVVGLYPVPEALALAPEDRVHRSRRRA